MTVQAVIVTHASAETLGALESSLAEHEPGAGLVVVDSGSPDGAPDVDPPALTVALEANLGYGAACNAGAALVLEDPAVTYLAFLNPDVRMVGPSLSDLARRLEDRPEVGIATGPVVDDQGRRQPSAWGPTSPLRAFWFATGWQMSQLRRVLGRVAAGGVLTSAATIARDSVEVDGHVLGGAMVVRRECWEQLGGFDEGFFLYWEDADICLRARELGWKVAVLPCTPIVHVGGTSSTGVSEEQRWEWYLEGARRFASRHLSPLQARRLLAALRLGRRLRTRSRSSTSRSI